VRLSRREWLAALPFAGRLAGQDPVVSLTADVGLVNLYATVRDQQGRVVRGLAKDDFELFEDQRRQTIRHFSAESDVPLRIGLLADVSGTMRKRIGEERGAARRFFRQVLRPAKDLAFVIRFDQWIETLQGPTSDSQWLNRAADELIGSAEWQRARRLDRPAVANAPCLRGSSAVLDAVFVVCRKVLRNERGRKALILMSDGIDEGSCIALGDVVEAAQRADAIVYPILLPERRPRPESLRSHPGVPLAQQLARWTGGRVFVPGVDGTAAKAFATIEEDLRHQYSIAYTSDRPSPGYHQLRLATRQGHAVQTREGYYGN
jgi:VWFA-related protein